jgi:hypothetical protein
MMWATSELIHFDRIASAWLIRRFIDPDAQFTYLKKNERVGDGVYLFGVPGVQLAMHDAESTTFRRILDVYSISDVALSQLGRVIAAGVEHVMHDLSRSGASEREPLAAGLLAVTEGVFLSSATDAECLDRCIPIYDALYTRLLAEEAVANASLNRGSVLEQTMAIAKATRELRAQQSAFSGAAFTDALRATASAPH